MGRAQISYVIIPFFLKTYSKRFNALFFNICRGVIFGPEIDISVRDLMSMAVTLTNDPTGVNSIMTSRFNMEKL